jgi:uncharacterized iron-regulated membrane protein
MSVEQYEQSVVFINLALAFFRWLICCAVCINVIDHRFSDADEQLAKVKSAYPHLQAAQYMLPISANQSRVFKMRGENFSTQLVFVNPYNGTILGDFNSSDRWYSIADTIHGTLLLGKFGVIQTFF